MGGALMPAIDSRSTGALLALDVEIVLTTVFTLFVFHRTGMNTLRQLLRDRKLV
jgi:hypothetical protein